jgi:carboxymethylenebutenolidase
MKKSILSIAIVLLGRCLFAQDFALRQLEASPRHHEWVKVSYGERMVHGFLAFPERADNTAAVIVIHENRGLTDWVRAVADELAAAGYLAIAPDLLSGSAPGGGKTSDFANADAAREAIYQLNPDQVTADLKAIKAYIATVPGCNGKVVVMGFCWGGAQTFRFATNEADIAAALPFYGGSPNDPAALANIAAPIYGFYGEDDQRVNASIAPAEAEMRKLGKTYDYIVYPGAGHAFMRRGDDPADGVPANKTARDEAWKRVLDILGRL